MIYVLLMWALTVAVVGYTWWCYRVGEISMKSVTVRRDEQPRTFMICHVSSIVICLLFAAAAVKETLAELR